ncbi:MAG TPA: polysaccharide pyruvyl transferase family protein [Actinomycetaceae bacterium]|nr:polysaccharide pyruvyl transferase family protein [Actinomycetaceae bacterium]
MALPSAPRAFVFLAADYGNIGDLAIAAAQREFLVRSLSGHHVVTVPISETIEVIRSIRAQVQPGDLVTITGGGNMGSIYPGIEEMRQLVIRSFPNNRIVCFPQTLDWDGSPESERALAGIARTYARHPDIHVYARESVTRAKLEELFRGRPNVTIGSAPDIVLGSTAPETPSNSAERPAGVLLCLRSDRERVLESDRRAQLEAALVETGERLETTDTDTGGWGLDESHRAQLLADKLGQFRSSRLVVTDRLHGMILSFVVGTPCLVLPSANHKIRQTWTDWLSDQPHVEFVSPDEFERLPEIAESLLAGGRGQDRDPPIDHGHFDELRRAVTHRPESHRPESYRPESSRRGIPALRRRRAKAPSLAESDPHHAPDALHTRPHNREDRHRRCDGSGAASATEGPQLPEGHPPQVR